MIKQTDIEKFQLTTVINKIRALKKFVKGIQGGTSSGKTYGIIPILIDLCIKTALTETSVVSESMPHLKRGAMKDFKKIMKQTGRWVESRWHGTDFKYTFSNGSFIEFFSAYDDTKLRGARRDYLYMNECNNLTLHSYNELAARTKKGIYLDWNPVNEFWFHNELQHDEDVDFIIVTYEDNEACPESALNFILKAKAKAATSEYWANWYRVYGLGLIGSLQGTIFDFKIVKEIPGEAKLISYGLDWGYTNDPSALLAVYRHDQKLYLKELIYLTGLTNTDISNKMTELNIDKSIDIICDSAEPKSIEDLYRLGWRRVAPSKKGPDSINASINCLMDFELNVLDESINLIKELRNYCWTKDKHDKQTNVPIGVLDHLIAGLRYVGLNKLRKTSRVSII